MRGGFPELALGTAPSVDSTFDMGAMVAILGEADDPGLEVRLDRMLERSPYRGTSERLVEGPLAIGVQTLGRDASMAAVGNWVVAFHGHIGNWDELAYGSSRAVPRDASNALRMAEAYEDLGDRLFARLRGEWAVLIWNRREKALLAARDFMGCRPLFWRAGRGSLYVASEVRQVLAGAGCSGEISWDYVRRFAGWEPNPELTVAKGVLRVPPGRLVEFGKRPGSPVSRAFVTLEELSDGPRPGNPGEAAVILHRLVVRSVKRSLGSGPVQVAVSGGLDSAAVWSALCETGRPGDGVSALSLRFPGHACDEGRYIDALLQGFDGTRGEVRMRTPEVEGRLRDCSSRVDGLCLANIMCQGALADAASGPTGGVVLTGHGGDLLFTGSPRAVLRALVSRPSLVTMMTALKIAGRSPVRSLGAAARMLAGKHDAASGFQGGCPSVPLEDALVLERSGWVLEPWEQVSASFGVETRHPLLDLDLLAFCWGLPSEWHYLGGLSKGLLRMAFASSWPRTIERRRSKVSLDPFLVAALGRKADTGKGGPEREDAGAAASGGGEKRLFGGPQSLVFRIRRYPGLDLILNTVLERFGGSGAEE